jgi:hypothetical protein
MKAGGYRGGRPPRKRLRGGAGGAGTSGEATSPASAVAATCSCRGRRAPTPQPRARWCRAAAPCLRMCEAALSGCSRGTLSEGVRGGIEQQHPVRGCARRRRAAAPRPRVCEAVTSGSTLLGLPGDVRGGVERRRPDRGLRGGGERRHPVRGCARRRRAAAPCPMVCKAATSGCTLYEVVRGGESRSRGTTNRDSACEANPSHRSLGFSACRCS